MNTNIKCNVESAKDIFEYKDGNLFWKVNMGSAKAGDIAGWNDGRGYFKVGFNNRSFYLHRIIYFMHHGSMPKFIDHIDGNPSNNKIDNLREATTSQNHANKNVRADSASGAKGVEILKSNRWRARIKFEGRLVSLGVFNSKEEASSAYFEAAKKIHGDFAKESIR